MGGYWWLFHTKLVMGGYLEVSKHLFTKNLSFGKGWHSNINRPPPISSKVLFERDFSLCITKHKGREQRKAYWVVKTFWLLLIQVGNQITLGVELCFYIKSILEFKR